MRRFIYFQDYHAGDRSIFANRALADELLRKCAGKFTDLLISVRSDDDGRCYFNSELYALRPERLDGLPPGQYFVREATRLGMRVHAWFYTAFFGSYRALLDPPPPEWSTASLDDPSCNQEDWINWSLPEVRQMVAQVSADLMRSNPGLAGIHLDYIRTRASQVNCPILDPDQITQTIELVRAAIDGEVTVAVSGSAVKNARSRRDIETWLWREIVDGAVIMSYTSEPLADRIAYARSLPNNHLLLPGVPTYAPDEDDDEQATFQEHLDAWEQAGFPNLSFFDSRTLDRVLGELPDLPVEPPVEPRRYTIRVSGTLDVEILE